MSFSMQPIGIIHTPFNDKKDAPIQSSRSTAVGEIEIFPDYTPGLEGIEGFSHLILIYVFHAALDSADLLVKPFLDDKMHGVFATRFYRRPNHIGYSVVRLLGRDGARLQFQCADMLDGTPLLDIKPYVPEFDVRSVERYGWYETRAYP